MRRIDRYLLAEAVPSLAFGALLYAVLAVTSVTLPRLQWLAGAPPLQVLAWLAAQLPTALAQTAPIAIVLAVLMTYGRMEGDHELLALRAGGVNLFRVIAPMLLLGGALTLGTLALYEWVTPRTHTWVAGQYWRLTAGSNGLFRLANQALPVGDFTLHFERSAGGGSRIEGVRIERWEAGQLTLVRANAGRFEGGDLVLTGYRTQVLDLNALDGAYDSARERLQELVRVDSQPPDAAAPLRLSVGLDPEELVARFSGGGFEDSRSLSELAGDWRGTALPADERRQAGVLLMRRLAEPFANLVLLLVALPLAVGWARGRGVAFGLSLVVTLVWYLLVTLGQFGAQSGTLPVWLGPWIANLVLGVVGVGLLVRLRAR